MNETFASYNGSSTGFNTVFIGPRKTAYKGTDKEMKCCGAQYELNIEYRKPEKENPRLCSADGFHYATRMKDVIYRYPLNDNNRYFEVEIIGNSTEEMDEGTTTAIKFIRELSKEEVQTKLLEDNLNLDVVRKLLTSYPQLHVAGSVALFLHGIRLKRWLATSNKSDMDIIAPYFDIYDNVHPGYKVTHTEQKKSGNDYDSTHEIITDDGRHIKMDVAIDPKEPFEFIEYNGFRYKVGKVEGILEAKVRYAMKGNQKHRNDVYEMIGKIK